MLTAVAIYARISSDRGGGGLGVARQTHDCRALAEQRGWTVTHVFVDNDVSAYSGKARPQYEAMLDAVAAKEVSGIVAWHPDRLHRSPKELEAFIDLIQSTGCRVDTVQTGHIDLSTATGQLNARVIGAFARYESQLKSERIKRQQLQNRLAGKLISGARRSYGWERDRLTLRPDEADAVRYAAERVIAGASLMSICRELNERGFTNTEGRPWRAPTLRTALVRPRNAGRCVYQGKVLPGVVGVWEPILTAAQLDTVTFLLTDPARRTNPGRHASTLLSAIARCGVCGSVLSAARGRVLHGVQPKTYQCMRCLGVVRNAEFVDAHVLKTVFAVLTGPHAQELVVRDDDPHAKARAAAEKLRARLLRLAEDFGDEKITRAERDTASAKIRPRLAALDARISKTGPPIGALADLINSDDLPTAWNGLLLEQQREIVSMLVTVVVLRTRRGPGFHPEHVLVEPIGAPARPGAAGIGPGPRTRPRSIPA